MRNKHLRVSRTYASYTLHAARGVKFSRVKAEHGNIAHDRYMYSCSVWPRPAYRFNRTARRPTDAGRRKNFAENTNDDSNNSNNNNNDEITVKTRSAATAAAPSPSPPLPARDRHCRDVGIGSADGDDGPAGLAAAATSRTSGGRGVRDRYVVVVACTRVRRTRSLSARIVLAIT